MEENKQLSNEEYLEIINKFKEENKEDYESGKIKKVFTDILPIGGLNRGKRINWEASVEINVYFIHKNTEGWIQIYKYIKRNKISISCNNNIKDITTNDLLNCKLGGILGKITSDFKIEIETNFKDYKRDITIIDREIRPKKRIDAKGNTSILKDKWYKYHCNKDGYEDWIVEGNLFKGHGCSLCTNQVVIQGINDIATTNPEMIEYFVGGYDEAKLYTYSSNQRIYLKCPDCGRISKKKIRISSLYLQHSIGCSCSDKISYGEKIMFSVLEQLGVDFQTQLNKSIFKWCQKYRYDFYFNLNGEDILTETHGLQHYEDAWNKLEITQLNDKIKKELALQNGIKEENYIIIDCRKSDLNWIKDNILESDLNDLFDLSKIDWNKAEEFALSNRVKEACDIKKKNILLSAKDISKIMRLGESTILKYIKLGENLNWCKYDAHEEMKKGHKKRILNNKGNYIVCLETGKIFVSCSDCSRKSLEVFGTYLNYSSICEICRNEKTKIKGFSFKYIKNLSINEYNYFNIDYKLKEFKLVV